ncbi:MAG: pyruvoyl-dependent arginine decarboxylase, partial [Calditrichota bacterium]
SAAVSVGVPADSSQVGVLMEGSFRCSAAEAEARVREMAQIALEDRGLEIGRIESVTVEHRIRQNGAALAAVLLWMV